MNRSRVSTTQRSALLEFMLSHSDLGRGRITGPEAARRKAALLEDMAALLNASGLGATKTPDKWWKCWQDWRSDTKAKALKIKKYLDGPGVGPVPAPLSTLEQNLLQFCSTEMVDGVRGVPDPMEVPESFVSAHSTQSVNIAPEADVVIEFESGVETELLTQEEKDKTKKDDSMLVCLERQAAAMERIAGAMEHMATNLADAIREFAIAMTHQPIRRDPTQYHTDSDTVFE